MTAWTHLCLIPRDPLIFGDGRNLNLFQPHVGEKIPAPSTLAGMLRTQFFETNPANDDYSKYLDVKIRGPWLQDTATERYFVPKPADAVCFSTSTHSEGEHQFHNLTLQPIAKHQRCYWPSQASLLANTKRLYIAENITGKKPVHAPTSVWPLDLVAKRLLEHTPQTQQYSNKDLGIETTTPLIKRESRTHVAIDKNTRTSATGMLFAKNGTRFSDNAALVFSAALDPNSRLHQWPHLPRFVTIGGESRTAILQKREISQPRCLPTYVSNDLQDASDTDAVERWLELYQREQKASIIGLRLYLATAAQCYSFHPTDNDVAWAPPWITNDGCQHPNAPDISLVFQGLCMPENAQFLSGWNLAAKPTDSSSHRRQEPRRIRRLVPAGTIFDFGFYNGVPPSTKQLATWLSCMWGNTLDGGVLPRDDSALLAAPSNDGYGVVLPGLIWDIED